MVLKDFLEKNKVYSSKVIGKEGIHRVRIINMLENTAVVELLNEEHELAVIKLSYYWYWTPFSRDGYAIFSFLAIQTPVE